MKQETKVAPAEAASRAWFGEKTRVMLTIAPSSVRALVAFSPSGPNGTLTVTCSWSVRRA